MIDQTTLTGSKPELTCGCDFCCGKSCGTCPACLPRIYEYNHPGMGQNRFGSCPGSSRHAEGS
jgi:hypothetical protein